MLKKHTVSIKHAIHGLMYSVKTQPNFRIHLLLSFVAFMACFFYGVSQIEFIIIILLITMGIVIETINTAVEQAADAVDLDIREDIRIIKDVAAAAMLVFAIGAIIISGIIFIPK